MVTPTYETRFPSPLRRRGLPRHVRIRQHQLADLAVEVVARGDELPQRAAGRRERVELLARQPVLGVGAAEVRRTSRAPRGSPGATGVSMRGSTGTSQALNRFCHLCGGEITTSPPMSSLQCMWFRNAADSSRMR